MLFLKHIAEDKRIWFFLFMIASSTIIIVDVATFVLRPPGLSHLILTFILVFLNGGVLLFYGIQGQKEVIRRKKDLMDLNIFEKRRKHMLRRRIMSGEIIITLCYECRFYNSDNSACKLMLPGRNKIFSDTESKKEICIYYEGLNQPCTNDTLFITKFIKDRKLNL